MSPTYAHSAGGRPSRSVAAWKIRESGFSMPELSRVHDEFEVRRQPGLLEESPDAAVGIGDHGHPVAASPERPERFDGPVRPFRPEVRPPVLGGDRAGRAGPGILGLESEPREERVEVERHALGVARVGTFENERAHPGDGFRLRFPESGVVVGDSGRPGNPFAIHVDEGASGVEEDGADAFQATPRAERAAASSSSAISWTSRPSGPSTRMRSNGSVPEYRRKTRPRARRACSARATAPAIPSD